MFVSSLSWKDKWKSMGSKFSTCTFERVTAYRSDDKCRDSIEAVLADIWNLKDWLVHDPTAAVPLTDIHALLQSPQSFNIRACGDDAMREAHALCRNSTIAWGC
jgi:hypothetical protein